jgi:hypothetical protein
MPHSLEAALSEGLDGDRPFTEAAGDHDGAHTKPWFLTALTKGAACTEPGAPPATQPSNVSGVKG